ncbi:MAG: hypothetical protein LBK71_05085 [Verrucomicrobiales bacterium]|jgi:hypothetical protein|nr:hypothetical protein [Verrucomicrobiales bacterium]
MTTTELELKTRRFTARMSDQQVARLHEVIEDILDERAFDRSAAGNFKSVPGEEVEARLIKKFGPKFARSLT